MSKKSVYKDTEQGWQYCSYCKQNTWHTPKLGLVSSNKDFVQDVIQVMN